MNDRNRNRSHRLLRLFLALFLSVSVSLSLSGCSADSDSDRNSEQQTTETAENTADTGSDSLGQSSISLDEIPEFSGSGYTVINDNIPFFTDDEKENTNAFETYSSLDSLGRCGVAYANICTEIMPTEERESISEVHPSGWDNTLRQYNRCHLIGFQLAGENANEKNLITGTRYLNVDGGMLPFENMVADYVKETGNHVLYRVTPVFRENELVCRGVLMEAYSVEDDGDGILFNVYCYNVQPGYTIDYATGHMSKNDDSTSSQDSGTSSTQETYILNTNTRKFHRADCKFGQQTSEKNREESSESRDVIISRGYEPCKSCNP